VFKEEPMTMRIDSSVKGNVMTFALSGRLKAEGVAEMQRLLEIEGRDHRIVLDLKNIKLAEGDAVRFLARCEESGIRIENCPAYIRAWIVREGAPMS